MLKFHSYFTLGAMFVKIDVSPGTAIYHKGCAERNVKYHTRPKDRFSCGRHPARRGQKLSTAIIYNPLSCIC